MTRMQHSSMQVLKSVAAALVIFCSDAGLFLKSRAPQLDGRIN